MKRNADVAGIIRELKGLGAIVLDNNSKTFRFTDKYRNHKYITYGSYDYDWSHNVDSLCNEFENKTGSRIEEYAFI